MLAMTLLLVDFVALPVSLIALVALLVTYHRRWTAWCADRGGVCSPCGRKED